MLKSRPPSIAAAPDESVDAVRRRALHRLVGSLVLVVLGVVGFPLVFDTEPRPLDSELQVSIPSKSSEAPSNANAVDTGSVPAVVEPAASASQTTEGEQPPSTPKAVAEAVEIKRSEAPPVTEAEPKNPVAPTPSVKPGSVAKKAAPSGTNPSPVTSPNASDEAARALAILEGKGQASVGKEVAGQWAVQVGSFSDPASVDRVRSVLKKAGFTAYVKEVQTEKGTLTRVRVGPFSVESEAVAATRQLQTLGLATSMIKL